MGDAKPTKPQSPRWGLERAVRESTLEPVDRLVKFVQAQEVNDSLSLGDFSPSGRQIASRTGLARSTVADCLRRLAETCPWTTSGRRRSASGRGSGCWKIVDERYARNRPLIVTSNLAPAELEAFQEPRGAFYLLAGLMLSAAYDNIWLSLDRSWIWCK